MVELHALLQGNDRVAIAAVGMSGVGKTTLARHYVKEYRNQYPGGVWWISAGMLVTEVLGYVERMGLRSELPTNWTDVQIVQHYFDRWQQQLEESKLLVLDDVGDYKAVKDFLPKQGSFRVLMTTKVMFGKPVILLPLGMLRPSAAFRLLRSHIDDDKFKLAIPVAKELCEWLGYLPLAIELVGRYLAETGTIASVLRQLKQKALDARSIDEVPDEMEYGQNVRAAIELSWEPLKDATRRVAMVLGLFALAPIETQWVQKCVNDDEVEEIIDRELVKRSLVEKTKKGYRLHSLVREFFREKLAGTEDAESVRRSFGQVMTEIARTIDDSERLVMIEAVRSAIPHIAESTLHALLLKEENITCSFIGLARFYTGQNIWEEAESWYKICLEFTIDNFGNYHSCTAVSLNNLAGLYASLGQYDRALPLYESALEICKLELEDQDSLLVDQDSLVKIMIRLGNLASLYRSMGHYDHALPLSKFALKISQSMLGDLHPDTATSLGNLAELYRLMGHYDRALPLFKSALEINQSELGDRHPGTAASLNNLAELYRSMGQYDCALAMHQSALNIRQSSLGDRHPHTATSLNNLAGLYYSIGQYDRALPLFESALEINQLVFGDRHPDTATNFNNLAGMYTLVGNEIKAASSFNRAMLICENLGTDYPITFMVLHNVVNLYFSNSKYARAGALLMKWLEICYRKLPIDHVETQKIQSRLADLKKKGLYNPKSTPQKPTSAKAFGTKPKKGKK